MRKLILYSGIALALVWLIRELEYRMIHHSNVPEFVKLRKTFLDSNSTDILIIGSSRAACQFNPEIIESTTGYRVWNAGMTGATLPFFRTTLEAYLENNTSPKSVLLNIDLHSFNDNNDTVFDYPRYFPYLENNALYNGLLRQDPHFKLYKWIAPYALAQGNTRLLNIALRSFQMDDDCNSLTCRHGFEMSQYKGRIGDLDTILYTTQAPAPSQTLLSELDAIVTRCKQEKIQLIFVITPLYKKLHTSLKNYNLRVEEIRRIATQSHTQFIDCSGHEVSANKQMYTDAAHLNRQGADLFSQHFADLLREALKQNSFAQ